MSKITLPLHIKKIDNERCEIYDAENRAITGWGNVTQTTSQAAMLIDSVNKYSELESELETLRQQLAETQDRCVDWATSKGAILAMYENSQTEVETLKRERAMLVSFVEECSTCAGGEVCGNVLSRKAKELLVGKPYNEGVDDLAPESELSATEPQATQVSHVCGLQGFGALDDVCHACSLAASKRKEQV